MDYYDKYSGLILVVIGGYLFYLTYLAGEDSKQKARFITNSNRNLMKWLTPFMIAFGLFQLVRAQL